MSSAHGEYLALLAEVKAHPDDDTPRLILADWLQDRGDPRGELLALELRRHLLKESDPERDALWLRERQLLRLHAFEWLGPLIDLAGTWTFHRGFLQIEARAERFLTDVVDELAETDLFAWIEALKLTDVYSQHLVRLARSPVLSVISCLDLSDNRIGDDGFARLLASPRLADLRELRLRRTRLSVWAVLALAECPHLSGLLRLDLSGNRFPDTAGLALAQSAHLGNLKRLDLAGHSLSSPTLEQLALRFPEVVWWERSRC